MAVRKTTTKTINGEEVIIKELLVEEILNFINSGTQQSEASNTIESEFDDIKGQIDQLLVVSVPGVKVEDLTKWAPSEIKKLYDAFKEVNDTFFVVAQRLGLNKLVSQVEQAIATEFSVLFANLPKLGTQTALSTDIASLSKP